MAFINGLHEFAKAMHEAQHAEPKPYQLSDGDWLFQQIKHLESCPFCGSKITAASAYFNQQKEDFTRKSIWFLRCMNPSCRKILISWKWWLDKHEILEIEKQVPCRVLEGSL